MAEFLDKWSIKREIAIDAAISGITATGHNGIRDDKAFRSNHVDSGVCHSTGQRSFSAGARHMPPGQSI